MHPEGLIGTLFSKCTYSIGSAGVRQRKRSVSERPKRRCASQTKRRQTDRSTLSFLTLRTSIGRPMRRLKPVCKESALKPSNPFVVATQRLPPGTPCEPRVLTVCCSSPHAWSRRYYDRQYLKITMPTPFGGPAAPLCGCSSRRPRIPHGMHFLQPAQCGAPQLAGGCSNGCTSTLGSQSARGPATLGGLCIT